jgi:hypothetical protein
MLALAPLLTALPCMAQDGAPPPPAQGKLPPPAELVHHMSDTYGFCFMQRRTLAHIGERFPELAPQLAHARAAWDAAFQRAEDHLATRWFRTQGPNWKTMRDAIEAQYV